MSDKNKTSVRIGQLFVINLKSGIKVYYQNFIVDTEYYIQNQVYKYMRIQFTGSSRNMTGENNPVTIEAPNVEPLKSFIYNNDGLRDVVIETTTFFPENPNATPFKESVQIKSSRFKGSIIEITAQSISAVQGKIPNIYYRSGVNPNLINIDGYVPEVPQNLRSNLV